jgi:hypothetical protein
MPKTMELISFATGVLAGTIHVRGVPNYMLSLLQLIITAMLRDKSVFVDGGVQLYRQDETTWLGFSKLSALRPATTSELTCRQIHLRD